jgi:hypothetical protein
MYIFSGKLQDSDENTSAPFFWAAAVYSGENTPIGNKGLSNLWWIIGGFTLVAMILARLINRTLRKNKRSNSILKSGN